MGRWLAFLRWSQHTVQKRTDVPWCLVPLSSLSCSLSPTAVAHLSEAGKPCSLQWHPPTPGCGSGCAIHSIRLTGLLLFWAFLFTYFVFVCFISIIKRYNKQLLMDTWVVDLPAQEISVIPRAGWFMATLLWMGTRESGSCLLPGLLHKSPQCLSLEALCSSPLCWTA